MDEKKHLFRHAGLPHHNLTMSLNKSFCFIKHGLEVEMNMEEIKIGKYKRSAGEYGYTGARGEVHEYSRTREH